MGTKALTNLERYIIAHACSRICVSFGNTSDLMTLVLLSPEHCSYISVVGVWEGTVGKLRTYESMRDSFSVLTGSVCS